ncbi:hypothetical protein HYY75_11965, partial [bacterium]|nr:hypothetical protein [bacterium]
MDFSPPEATFRDYVAIVRKQRAFFLLPFLLIFSAGIWNIFEKPPMFETTATVVLEQSQITLGSNQESDSSLVQKFIEIAKAPSVVEEVLKTLKLDVSTDEVISNMLVRKDPQGAIIKFSLQGHNPKQIQSILDSFVQVFLRRSEELTNRQADELIQSIAKQASATKVQLHEIEKRLRAFQEKEKIISIPDEMNRILERINYAKSRLLETEFESTQVEKSVNDLRKKLNQLRGKAKRSSPRQGDFVGYLRQELTKLEMDSMTLSQIYTENHPKKLENRRKINFLKRKIEREAMKDFPVSDNESAAVFSSTLAESIRQENQFVGLAARQVFLKGYGNSLDKEFLRLSEKRQEFSQLERRQKSLEQSYSLLEQKKNIGVLERDSKKIRLIPISPAYLPKTMMASRRGLSLLFVLFIACLGGISTAFLAEHLDENFSCTEDAARILGLPIYGWIPDLGPCSLKAPTNPGFLDTHLVSYLNPDSNEGEAFKMLRTNFLLLNRERPFQTFSIVSQTESAGKSTILANLALCLAGAGYKVILVDANFRSPSLHKLFRLENTKGFS